MTSMNAAPPWPLLNFAVRRLVPEVLSLVGRYDDARHLRCCRVVDKDSAARVAVEVDDAVRGIDDKPWNLDAWRALSFISGALTDARRARDLLRRALECAECAAQANLRVGETRGWASMVATAKSALAEIAWMQQRLGS